MCVCRRKGEREIAIMSNVKESERKREHFSVFANARESVFYSGLGMCEGVCKRREIDRERESGKVSA